MTRADPAAALLDRDGTINVKAPEGEYLTEPAQLVLLPGAAAAVRALNDAGVPVLIVTNQRGIALGRMTEDGLAAVHTRLRDLLHDEAGAWIDGIFHCPHDRGACDCRKPGTLLLRRAAEYAGIAGLQDAVMIGDSLGDVRAGRAVGARSILLTGTGTAGDGDADGDGGPFEVAGSLLEAVERVLSDRHAAAAGA
jgi:D-glycero-D-manno-heptose 1,7-bisphosphate phosphatase